MTRVTVLLVRPPYLFSFRHRWTEFGHESVLALIGRLRSQATFAARHNTVFQGLAADGAKLALWQLWRAGYRIVNFIHDEVRIELAADVNLAHHAEIVRYMMINAMREVLPDVRVDVQYALSDRWAKDAEVFFDDAGRLGMWRGEERGDAA